jgi:hypothetical protein
VSDDEAVTAPRYQIVAGGEPSPEELAAVAIALTPVVIDDREPGTRSDLTGWLRAALHEGVGGAPLISADQVAGLR